MTSHTPRITAEGFDPESGGFAYVMVDGVQVSRGLIAAAPALLEALQRLAGMLSGDSMSAQDRRDAYEIADAAIAKATGAPQ